jgi:hypothetical protein
MTYVNVHLVLLVRVHDGGCGGWWCCGMRVTLFRGAVARERRGVSCLSFVVRPSGKRSKLQVAVPL